ncbi:MAG: hypothetical protein A2V88_17520 [Elusimicrobia bacterium RBG_16_66_12]|nr:MAG: hypothetical protein A2V88_17520 [Elusimicrobia bacterium RBG_16_66_12]
MRMPASAGPTMREAFRMRPLSAIALPLSSGGTSSGTKACRAGMSKALTAPRKAASATTCQTCTRPRLVMTASAAAWMRAKAWVQRSTLRRSQRSAAAPPARPRTSAGAWDAAAVRPRRAAEPVMR